MKTLLSLLLCVCAIARAKAEPVWVVGNGFHSSLGFRLKDLPAWRVRGADHLLIGWGDAEWYRGHINPGTFCAAVFWPTHSLLHVVPVDGEIARSFSRSDVVRIELTHAQFEKLADVLENSFAKGADGKLVAAGSGFVSGSRFFAGREHFYFPKMCNYWVAEKLQRSGLPIHPWLALTSSGLLHQAGKLGTREQFHRKPADVF